MAARWKRMMASRMINMAALPWEDHWLAGCRAGQFEGLSAGAAAVCDCHRPTVSAEEAGKRQVRNMFMDLLMSCVFCCCWNVDVWNLLCADLIVVLTRCRVFTPQRGQPVHRSVTTGLPHHIISIVTCAYQEFH